MNTLVALPKSLVGFKGSIAVLLLFAAAGSVYGQNPADPKAVDLTTKLVMVDSLSGLDQLYTPFNIGDVNADGSDDLLVVTLSNDTSSQSHLIYDRGLLTSTGNITLESTDLQNVIKTWDVDGDGRKDAVYSHDDSTGRSYFVRKATGATPTFGSPELLFKENRLGLQPILIEDINGDGRPDLVAITGNSKMVYALLGAAGSTEFKTISDSVVLSAEDQYGYLLSTAVGTFTPGGERSIVIVSSQQTEVSWTWTLHATAISLTNGNSPLGDAKTVFADTIPNQMVFVYSAPSAVGDITGDGVDDLLIGDSGHVYVIAGGSDFGQRIRTKDNADAIITAPAVLDPFGHPNMETFTTFHVAKDLAGTGVPYLAVTVSGNTGTVYLYAGGSALDTRYDGLLNFDAYVVQLVPVHITPGRDGFVILYRGSTVSKLYLLHEGTELLPHQQAGVGVAQGQQTTSEFTFIDSRTLSLFLSSDVTTPLQVEVIDILGRTMLRQTLTQPERGGSLRISLNGLPSGGYLVRATDGNKTLASTLIRAIP